MTEVPWLDARELRAWHGLQFMQMRLVAELSRRLAAGSDLSYPDYLVLVALTDQPDGRQRLSELGRDLGAKRPCASDRRGSTCS
jgi:DNA-binding MarR family transcriptional regulator